MHRRFGLVNLKIPSLLLILAFVIAGCGSDSPSEPTAETQVIPADADAGTVTGTNAGTGTDADTGNVTGTDAGNDTGNDTGNNTGNDAGNNTGTDAETAGETGSGTTDAGTTGEVSSSPTTVGDANCPALSATGNTASIAGLYDFSNSFESGLLDVAYLAIDSIGNMTVYDYQQDDHDEGNNCYIISKGTSVLSPLGDNEFISTIYIDEDEDCETTTAQAMIIRTETELTSTYVDVKKRVGAQSLSKLQLIVTLNFNY